MQNRPLPNTDLSVSLLGFGNFVFGTNWWGDFTDDEAVNMQNRAVDLGVNFFDTAPAYGNGRAESLMKRTIADVGRDNIVLSTKFGYDFYSDSGEEGSHRERKQDFSAKAIRFELEQSLTRMGVDVIDLYQAHNVKLPHMNDEMFETLDALVAEGKLKSWGIALGPAIGWREEGHKALNETNSAVIQTVMNLYEQDPGRELCEAAVAMGKGGIIARVPTNSGILDEEFKTPDHKFEKRDHRKFRDKDWLIYGLKKNEILQPIAAELGLSVRGLAIRWLASVPGVMSIEPNIITVEDLEDYAKACDGQTLPDDVMQQLDELYAKDYDFGEGAHPCDLKSSVAEGGSERSRYLPAMAR